MLAVDNKIYYALRITSAMCFIGHGAFGIITKQIWCNYFAVFGIGHDLALHLMPILGSVDILMGLSLLIYPTRAILLWLVAWGIITASLRPLSGEPFAEFIERAGNFGAPLTLLLLCGFGGKNIKQWFARVKPDLLTDEKTLATATMCLRIVVFLLLAGHGWLNLLEKKGLMNQYASLGFSSPAQAAQIAGAFEILSACLILVKPLRSILVVLLIWKAGTELFYPHWEVFEWVERGGSYGTILALLLILPQSSKSSNTVPLNNHAPAV
jgi:hypothetical protein